MKIILHGGYNSGLVIDIPDEIRLRGRVVIPVTRDEPVMYGGPDVTMMNRETYHVVHYYAGLPGSCEWRVWDEWWSDEVRPRKL
jgi:hypothetical protein